MAPKFSIGAKNKKQVLQGLKSILKSFIIATWSAAPLAFILYYTAKNTLNVFNKAHAWQDGCWTAFPGRRYYAAYYGNILGTQPNECLPVKEFESTNLGLALSVFSAFIACTALHFAIECTDALRTLSNVFVIATLGAMCSALLLVYAYEAKAYNKEYHLYKGTLEADWEWYTVLPEEDKLPDFYPHTVWAGRATMYSIFFFHFIAMATWTFQAFREIQLKVLSFVYFGALYGIMMLYTLKIPAYYKPPATNGDKVTARLLLHTLMFEFCNSLGRMCYKKSDKHPSASIAFLYFSFMTGGFYGRILVSSITDQTILIVSSIGVGVIEVVLRLTAFQRDTLINGMVSKITGKKTSEIDSAGMKMRKATLIVIETELELTSVITAGIFFVLLLNKKGPMMQEHYPLYQKEAMAGLGFDLIPYVLENSIIQVVFELLSDSMCMVVEIFVIKINPLDIADISVKQSICQAVFFAAFLVFFVTSLFVFPIRFSTAISSRLCFDLDLTWISVIPVSIEMPYLQAFLAKKFG